GKRSPARTRSFRTGKRSFPGRSRATSGCGYRDRRSSVSRTWRSGSPLQRATLRSAERQHVGAAGRASGLRVADQEVDVRGGLGLDEDLIREQALADANQQEVGGEGGAAESALAEHLREGRGHALDGRDAEAGVTQQMADGAEVEEARVRAIE